MKTTTARAEKMQATQAKVKAARTAETTATNSFFANMDALTAAVENVDSSFTECEIMTVETAGAALLEESINRLAGFTPRADIEQDILDQAIASSLQDADKPMQVIINNIVRCIQGISAPNNNIKSNADACGVTDAPQGTKADEYRDELEGILKFVRALAKQATRASFYRYRSAERALEKTETVVRDEAGQFTGFYTPTDYAVMSDNNYEGWNKIQVTPDTIIEAAEQLIDACRQIWSMCLSRGVCSAWFTQTQSFNTGGHKVEGSDKANDYVNYVGLVDAWEHFEQTQGKQRVRKSGSDIARNFRV